MLHGLIEHPKRDEMILATVLTVIGLSMVAFASHTPDDTGPRHIPDDEIPEDYIHWHARLDITINDEPVVVPANIGITQGNVIDRNISRVQMSPIHTHDVSGVLHIEQMPTERTMTVGYFINDVWGERFTSECILEACNDDRNAVKIFVNGERIYEYEDYIIRNNDIIEIRYEEYIGGRTAADRQLV